MGTTPSQYITTSYNTLKTSSYQPSQHPHNTLQHSHNISHHLTTPSQHPHNTFTTPSQHPHNTLKTGNITKAEIKKALKSLNKGKAAGCDDIPPEAWKSGGVVSEKILYSLLNKIWEKEVIPEDWKKGILIKLPKKGDLTEYKNWRGIMLLSIAS